jgi:hypothetical protein
MGTFNNAYDENKTGDAYELVPTGDYIAAVVSTNEKISKTGSKYISLCWEILDGAMKERKIFDNLNLWHPEQRTVDFAERTLNNIRKATGKLSASEPEDFHNIPCHIRVGINGDFNTI